MAQSCEMSRLMVAVVGLAAASFIGARSAVAQAFAEGKAPVVARAEGLDDADNVRVDGANGQLGVGAAHALAVLDPKTLRLIKRIELAGHPDAFELERAGARAHVNVPSAGHIAVVDRARAQVTATWDLGGAARNFPMALDESRHRLFIGTRQPARMLVYDTTTGKRNAELPVCGDADDLFYDGQRRQLYTVCGEGVVDVIVQRDADHYEVAECVQTSSGARTGPFVPQLSALFVAVPSRGGSSAEIRVYRVE